jgi:hypothetical protein
MNWSSPFDHRPHPELGALLREALTPGEEQAFVDRVLARAATEGGSGYYGAPWWQVLGTWARPGVAAAVVLLAAATFWFRNASTREADTTLEDVLLATAETVAPPFLTAATSPPTFDVVLASTLEP